MGGGKSRAMSEQMFDYMLQYPGMVGIMARQRHTSITETTKKTMLGQVVPSSLIARKKESGGEDYIELINGSVCHFIGLEDPVRWFSAEISVLMVDQVEECEQDTIVKMMTRLRWPIAPKSFYSGRLAEVDPKDFSIKVIDVEDFEMNGKVVLSFNPENPDHWLQKWFFVGANPTKYGYQKSELTVNDADFPIGNCEFFFASALDNPHTGADYVARLAGQPAHLRRRYLEGVWEFISGECFFDNDALQHYSTVVEKPWRTAKTRMNDNGKASLVADRNGHWWVWKTPEPEHRYVISVDVSSGGSTDYSGIQVVDVESFSQVAEFQAKLDPDLVAVEAARAGWIYNDALIAPEITGGWGHSVVRELERIGYRRIHTRRAWDRIAKKWSDKLGWDTNNSTRAHMLDTLERVLREQEFGLRSHRCLNELGSFVRDEKGRPGARSGSNDDLVMALAIAVAITLERPRTLRKPVYVESKPSVSGITGY